MTPQHDVDVAVVGGGIGGLAATVALRAAGIDAHAFEQATVLAEIGGAVVIREPSVALLDRWGLAERFLATAVRFSEIELRTAEGDVLGSGPTEVEPGEPAWAYSVHRADLHNLLRSVIPEHVVHLGHRVRMVAEHGTRAEALFDNDTRIRARALVGADGLRSVVRPFLDDAPLEFTGLVAYRTLVAADVMPAELPNDRLRLWRNGNRTILTLPLRGGRQIAIDSALVNQDTPPPAELWSATVTAEELLTHFPGFEPRITNAIRIGGTASAHPVYDRAPTPHWSTDRITLLGDAAHPMAPLRGQGANQAIQDAAALAEQLRDTTDHDIPVALQRYQNIRAPHTAAIQRESRAVPAWMSTVHG